MALPAFAWDMAGTKTITMHGRDGKAVPIGSVTFRPDGGHYSFSVKLDYSRFKDHFLSMKEFKCLEGSGEIECHVPYPYAHPDTVTATDLRWLEHSLLFLYKSPKDYGANLWNGLYYRMKVTDEGIVGTPQAIDLNLISAPPDDLSVPPYGAYERSDIAPGTRWFERLTIE
jgi:hypothetical protein